MLKPKSQSTTVPHESIGPSGPTLCLQRGQPYRWKESTWALQVSFCQGPGGAPRPQGLRAATPGTPTHTSPAKGPGDVVSQLCLGPPVPAWALWYLCPSLPLSPGWARDPPCTELPSWLDPSHLGHSLPCRTIRITECNCAILFSCRRYPGGDQGWTRWPTEVPSNPEHSVILWFCVTVPCLTGCGGGGGSDPKTIPRTHHKGYKWKQDFTFIFLFFPVIFLNFLQSQCSES